MKINELKGWAEFKGREASLNASYFPNEKAFQKEKESCEAVVKLINKEIEYVPKKDWIGNIDVHTCKCGASYIDACFDGYCGKCGQKLRWEEND